LHPFTRGISAQGSVIWDLVDEHYIEVDLSQNPQSRPCAGGEHQRGSFDPLLSFLEQFVVLIRISSDPGIDGVALESFADFGMIRRHPENLLLFQ
jgi:hypothetical protein